MLTLYSINNQITLQFCTIFQTILVAFLYAALVLVIGQLLYTVGWTSRRVRDVCGDHAGPFVLDQCHIGQYQVDIILLAACKPVYQKRQQAIAIV